MSNCTRKFVVSVPYKGVTVIYNEETGQISYNIPMYMNGDDFQLWKKMYRISALRLLVNKLESFRSIEIEECIEEEMER